MLLPPLPLSLSWRSESAIQAATAPSGAMEAWSKKKGDSSLKRAPHPSAAQRAMSPGQACCHQPPSLY
jgi:hypothetical protein